MCEHMHCMPRPGGLLDQDSFLVYGMFLVAEAKRNRQSIEDQKADQAQRRTMAARVPRG